MLVQSQSQIFFNSNWITGLFMLAAFFVYDWHMGLFVLLGTAAAVGTARLLGSSVAELAAGVQGFCGALVGAAAYVSLGPTRNGMLATIIGGALSIVITILLTRLFATRALRRFSLPYTTAPFCTASGILLVLTTDFDHHVTPKLTGSESSLLDFGHSVLSAIAEVVLVDSALAGTLILIGLFFAHWKVGVAALLGGTFESGARLLLDTPPVNVYHGLAGYSGVLVAIALATVFIAGTWQPWVTAVAGLLLILPVEAGLQWLHIPIYTWPYVITTWLMLVIVSFIPAIRRT